MKILYCCMQFDYGQPFRGYSFEHVNFYSSLKEMGHEVSYFDFPTVLGSMGREGMNAALLQRVEEEKPDLLFCSLFRDELIPETIREISEGTDTVTFNWFADDHWRFEEFSSRWAPCFDYVSTTDRDALPKYAAIGYDRALLTQWACSPAAYARRDNEYRYAASFVGAPHGKRREIIRRCREAGIVVETFGFGWSNGLCVRGFNFLVRNAGLPGLQRLRGRITHEEMIDIFCLSRINLNLTSSSEAADKPQIKGRNFEVPGVGGFLLTEAAPGLDEYFEPDREIVLYSTTEELIDKAKFFLDHDAERERIRERGYRRAVTEHTYARRFDDLFGRMEWKKGPRFSP